jgi:hypothetical protein
MTQGGARNRSGPAVDPNSATSERRGLKFKALPAGGYQGEIPEWPLRPSATDEVIGSHEVAIWRQAWRSPQAAAWAAESWRWPIIGEYCRLKAIVEFSPAVSAALVGQLHRYRDQIGLTPAGLKENGWQIAGDELAERRTESKRASSRDRMKVVGGDE